MPRLRECCPLNCAERSRRWRITRRLRRFGGMSEHSGRNFRSEAKIDERGAEARLKLLAAADFMSSLYPESPQGTLVLSWVNPATAPATSAVTSRIIRARLSPHAEFVEWEHQRRKRKRGSGDGREGGRAARDKVFEWVPLLPSLFPSFLPDSLLPHGSFLSLSFPEFKRSDKRKATRVTAAPDLPEVKAPADGGREGGKEGSPERSGINVQLIPDIWNGGSRIDCAGSLLL